MLASIWLQLPPPQEATLQGVIDSVARAQGTVAFQPHLTVCGGELDPASWDAAADYARRSRAIPLKARARKISYLGESPFRAVFVEMEADAELKKFREELRAITRATDMHMAHISLFYRLDAATQRPIEGMGAARLRAIADDCARLVPFSEYSLERPAIVSTDGSWANVKSWKVVRELLA